MTSVPGAGSDIAGGDETIVALATPPGRSALSMVRLSGPEAHAIAGAVVTPWPLPERSSALCSVRDPRTGALIDRAIVTVYASGRSYTGEAVVEIATHGGYVVPAMTMAALVAAGAREALPGEFTRRAVLNGKLDLLRAEAVGDLIDARSRLMQQWALRQLDGGLSRRVEQFRRGLVEIEALIAYDIDFPEEDDGPIARGRVIEACDALLAQLAALLSTAPAGALVREGALVVLAGPTNAGKSSLYNALLGERRALVTPIPGTTRDALESVIDVEGWPLRLVDTAGLRPTEDALEQLGIEVSERYLAQAHVVLACGETPSGVTAAVDRVGRSTGAPVIPVRTKSDLVSASDEASSADLLSSGHQSADTVLGKGTAALDSQRDQTKAHTPPAPRLVSSSYQIMPPTVEREQANLVTDNHYLTRSGSLVSRSEKPGPSTARGEIPIHVSAVTGEGLADLRAAIVGTLMRTYGAASADLPVLTRARHVRALESALEELAAFRAAWVEDGLPAPVAAVHLRDAVVSLESLVGAVDLEDVLDQVFSAFCIGK